MTGTPYYVCPEQVDVGTIQIRRRSVQSRAYSTNQALPFTGNKLIDIFDGHRNGLDSVAAGPGWRGISLGRPIAGEEAG